VLVENQFGDILSKDLRRWFKEKWVDVSRKDKDGKHPPCGRDDAKTDSKGYPKCRPSKKVSKDTPKTTQGTSANEKKAMTRRKRSKPQGVGGKPTMVKSEPFEEVWESITKGKFSGYTRSNISNRPYRQAEHRVWDVSRKVKRERTKRRYARNKSRGVVRPKMRRQLGRGGKRASTTR
jgi:hypothetical protein